MKMYDGVLARVRQVEEKAGIHYMDTSDMPYKVLKFFLVLAIIFTVGVNLILIIGFGMDAYEIDHSEYVRDGKSYTLYEVWELDGKDAAQLKSERMKHDMGIIINCSAVTVLIITGAVLNKFKLYIAGGMVCIAPAVYAIFYFKNILTDSNGMVGINAKYYWCHLLPLAIIILCILCMTVIAVRADFKLKNRYKKVTENLFKKYCESLPEGKTVNDSEWEEYLKNYLPAKDEPIEKEEKKSQKSAKRSSSKKAEAKKESAEK
ncbi:MAG: hypothetical protein U0K93_03180 [Acutalibacteraceae bacterium]|nr:hypothetical protein [Acutalibacteraceae bacterium]